MGRMEDEEAAQRAREAELRENRVAKKEFLSDTERVSESVKSLRRSSSGDRSLQRKIDREIRRAAATGKPSSWLLGQLVNEDNKRNAKIQASGSQQQSTPSIQVAQTISLNPDNQFSLPSRSGSYIRMNSTESAGGGGRRSWDMLIVGEEGDEHIEIVAGTVNGILPSNWDAEFSGGRDGTYYGIVEVNTDGNIITSVNIVIANSPVSEMATPKKFALPSQGRFTFGKLENGANTNFAGGGNIHVIPTLWKTAPSGTNDIGQPLIDHYYALV